MEATQEIKEEKQLELNKLKERANTEIELQRGAANYFYQPPEYKGDVPFGGHEKDIRRPEAVEYALLTLGRGKGTAVLEYLVQTGKEVSLIDTLTISARKGNIGRETSVLGMQNARYIEVWYDVGKSGKSGVGKVVTFSPHHVESDVNRAETFGAVDKVRNMVKVDTGTVNQLRELTPNKIIDKFQAIIK